MLSLSEKHRAKYYKDIIGQEKAIFEIRKFLQEFSTKSGKKALLLYGPAGTGKTSLALAAARENDIEVLELNASDLRNRQKLEDVLKPAAQQQSLFKKGRLLLMDEVDGVTGTDIGGIPELVRILSETKYPIIMTCNDAWQSKLSPVRAQAKLVEMKALDSQTIIKIMSAVCFKEGITNDPSFLQKIAIKSQGDIRAALNDLQSYSEGEDIFIDTNEKRDVEQSIFNILKNIFKERKDFLELFETTKMSLDEIFLWIEENIPKEYRNEALARAYLALANADVFRGRIYRHQSWRFLVYQNIFQSAGISYAKKIPGQGFTKYENPKRILKIWLNNQKTDKKKTIARKYAHTVHCSMKRAMRDFELIKRISTNPVIQKQLKLTEDEIDFLRVK